jgi:hypothetical protein
VVTPASLRPVLGAGLDADGLAWSPELRAAAAPIVVLTADEAKGLEFDNVVVVEPATIVAESQYGLASLFVALTRCTSRLAIVHTEPLPAVLGLDPEAAVPRAEAEAEAVAEVEAEVDVGVAAEPVTAEVEPAARVVGGADDQGDVDPGRTEVDLRVVEQDAELMIDDSEDVPDTSEGGPCDRESLADSAVADGTPSDDAMDAMEAMDAMDAMDDGVAAGSAAAEPAVGAAGDGVGTGPVDAIGDFDREIAGAIAATVADAVLRSTTAVTLPLVAAELARLLAEGSTGTRPDDQG